MKALVVTPYYYPKIGGLENYARQLGIALKDLKKWEIVVVTSGDNKIVMRQEKIDGMNVYRLSRWFKLSNTPVNPLWPLQIRRIIKTEKPDLIIAHSPVPSMSDSAAIAAGSTPFVLVYHAASLLKDGSKIFNLVAKAYGLVEVISFTKAKKIIVVSDFVKEQMSPKLQSKISVVPNSVWGSDVVGRKSQPKSNKFLFIGSLDKSHAWKGLDQIIEALSIYKQKFGSDIALEVMGGGNNLEAYESQVVKLGLKKNVVFLGPKSGIEKDRIINNATALIAYPTTSNDAFPTVMLEAWAKGVPVVSANIGPITSLVNDYKDGYLVEPSNPEALAEKMSEVLSSKLSSRQSVAETAKSRTAKKYTWEIQATEFSKLAKELI